MKSNTLLTAICTFASALISYASEGFDQSLYSDSSITPSPAVIAAAPSGEVFVGIDMQGSLGKKVGKGKIVRLVDTNADGTPDKITQFTEINNPRGITVLGDQVFVLHTVVKGGEYENQQLSVFLDRNFDGVADGPAQSLVTNIGNSKFIQSRGLDHCTNNIRFAGDGWIYIAVGDFGMVNAEGTDGRKLTMHGGVARVRPDGSGLEMYMKNTRNVYDVAIDPEMNLFTRENTNDGIGWWVRSSHYIQSGDYGYPSLYTNFPEDMIPAMGEYGAGSGVGALYLEEPQWPENLKNSVLLADWGHNKVYSHELSPLGATFSNKVKEFLNLSQVSDLDVDGSGRLYVSAWNGAGYQGSPKKGFVHLVTPKGWKYKPFPDLKKLNAEGLLKLLESGSHTARVHAAHELVSRKSSEDIVLNFIKDSGNSKHGRIAAIYIYSQIKREAAISTLQELSQNGALREHAIRAMADDLAIAKVADSEVVSQFLSDPNPRVQAAAVIALGRIGDKAVAQKLLPIAAAKTTLSSAKATGKPVFKSKPLSKISDSRSVKVNLKGLSQLVLIVDQVDHNKYDQAAWIDPVIILENGKKIDLTTLEPLSVSLDRGLFGVNQDCEGKPLTVKGKAVKGIGVHAQAEVVYAIPEGGVMFTATGVLTAGSKGKGKHKGKVAFWVSEFASKPAAQAGYIAANAANPHSVPNESIILPHLAQKALVSLKADEMIAEAILSGEGDTYEGALITAKFMHSVKVVDALIEKASINETNAQKIAPILARLHQQEKAYDGQTWWGTRPSPDGPYFTPVSWKGSEMIDQFFSSKLSSLGKESDVIALLKKNKAYVPDLNPRPKDNGEAKVAKIGSTGIEDVVLFMEKYKGKPNKGAQVIAKVGCVGCHNIDKAGVVKAPDLAKLGHMSYADLTEAIIKPGATIAPTWVTLSLQDGQVLTGTIVKEDPNEVTLHNIAGIPTVIKVADIKTREPGLNMMSLHLTDSLTLPEFGDLLFYIKSLDSKK